MTENKLIDFEIHACATCGILYAITKQHEDRLRSSHSTFYCPNGHSQWYPGETNEEKILKLEDEIKDCKNISLEKKHKIAELEKKVLSYKMLYSKEKKKNLQLR